MNNKWMGMVRQWQELLHGGRFSESYTAALPDFVKLAEAFGAAGVRAETVDDLDSAIARMLSTPGPVILDVLVDETEMCFPMIPGGAAHNEIMLGPNDRGQQADAATREEGMVLV
jgi:acetolactate synthase-1/2/3 large subunit